MKTRFIALILTVAMLLTITAGAMAVTIPETVDPALMDELPETPTMKTKNDGVTQHVYFSAPVDWAAAIWNWNWNELHFDNAEKTEASIEMAGHGNAAQGYGIWVNANVDPDGTVTWAGTGTYLMDYAYDAMVGGVNVKYGIDGSKVIVTVNKAGTEYFGNGPSKATTVVYRYLKNSVDKVVPYVDEIKEEYEDGSFIHGRFAMNGKPSWVYQIDANGKHTVLFGRAPAPAKEPEQPTEPTEPTEPSEPSEPTDEPTEEDLVIFEGSQKLNGQPDWNEGWIDRTDHLDLAGKNNMDKFVSGTSLKITWEFPYEDWKTADWSNGPMIVVQPTDNWAWAQVQSDEGAKADGVTTISFDTLSGTNGLGDPTPDRDYKYFGIYPLGTELTITRVEVVK